MLPPTSSKRFVCISSARNDWLILVPQAATGFACVHVYLPALAMTLINKPVCTVVECRMCLDSDFFDLWRSCGDCNITYSQPECQLSCQYCLAGEGIDTSQIPAPRADQLLAIPSAGCSVDRRNFQLECRPLSEGNCGETRHHDVLQFYSQLPAAPASCSSFHNAAMQQR